MVLIDDQAMKWIECLKESSARLVRWPLRLMKFELEIVHKPRAVYEAPDGLSRLPTVEPGETDIVDEVPVYRHRDSNDMIPTGINIQQTDVKQY